jgi:hypothetical protein
MSIRNSINVRGVTPSSKSKREKLPLRPNSIEAVITIR